MQHTDSLKIRLLWHDLEEPSRSQLVHFDQRYCPFELDGIWLGDGKVAVEYERYDAPAYHRATRGKAGQQMLRRHD